MAKCIENKYNSNNNNHNNNNGINSKYNIHVRLINTLLHPSVLINFHDHIQCIYIQSAIKVFIYATRDCESLLDISIIISLLKERLPLFMQV